VIDLIDACRPGVIKYDLVKDAFTEEVRNVDFQSSYTSVIDYM